jgi:hypothetical protein
MTDAITYQHRAKPYAPEAEFVLKDDHVAITQGARKGNFPYRDIDLIRLTYRPRNTTNEGYVAKIYRRDRKTASLTNLSWKSLVDMERQDASYAAFVRALIGRITAANPAVALQAGMPRWLHLITGAFGAAAVLTMIVVTAQAIRNASWPIALMTGALALYFGWWSWRYLTRNRPRRFTPDALPADVMPPIVSPPKRAAAR